MSLVKRYRAMREKRHVRYIIKYSKEYYDHLEAFSDEHAHGLSDVVLFDDGYVIMIDKIKKEE